MKKVSLILFYSVFALSVHSQIVVPLTLPDNCNVTTGITEQLVDQTPKLTLYPNPNDGNFTVNIKSPEVIDNVRILIFNSLGVEFYQKIVYCNSKNLVRQVKVSNLPSGVYYIKVHSDSFKLNASFIIQK